MILPPRESPVGKRVSFFVTCIMDMIYPDTGMSVIKLLEYLKIEVDFPASQTCCAQPAFNAGYRKDARSVAMVFLEAFKDAEVIVTASGSCAAMVRHEYPNLFVDDPDRYSLALQVASRTWEITEYIVDGLGIKDLHLKLPRETSFAFHDACHGLRLLGLGPAAHTLLEHVENATVQKLHDSDVCCGFGGLFSVKMPDISNAMLVKKCANINGCEADVIVTGDVSCMTQINGGLSRQKSPKRVRHIVDVLAEALPDES